MSGKTLKSIKISPIVLLTNITNYFAGEKQNIRVVKVVEIARTVKKQRKSKIAKIK